MAKKPMSKKSTNAAVATRGATPVRSRTRSKTRRAKTGTRTEDAIPRATSSYDDDDVLLSGGGSRGASFGRCGGRILSSQIEQSLCDKLSRVGVTHSHSPRHFEVQLEDESVGAYAPMIVLRGRGREGKTVVIEAAGEMQDLTLRKIAAFRRKLGPEFYVIFVAPEEILDEVSISVYDESCTTTDLDTLVSRLAD
ncbi:MAG: hypothetical protein AAF628_24620 [Planctomycetota bacterium]